MTVPVWMFRAYEEAYYRERFRQTGTPVAPPDETPLSTPETKPEFELTPGTPAHNGWRPRGILEREQAARAAKLQMAGGASAARQE